MNESHIEKLAEATIHSIDAVERAEPKPYLLTRVMAAINKGQQPESVWTKAAAFISRPGIAIAGTLLIVLINTSIILTGNDANKSGTVQNSTVLKDDFAINASNIYDIENPEP
jgi:hypothetical protein